MRGLNARVEVITHSGSPFHAALPAEHPFRDEEWKRREGKERDLKNQ